MHTSILARVRGGGAQIQCTFFMYMKGELLEVAVDLLSLPSNGVGCGMRVNLILDSLRIH